LFRRFAPKGVTRRKQWTTSDSEESTIACLCFLFPF
jgi:hypothetical protein